MFEKNIDEMCPYEAKLIVELGLHIKHSRAKKNISSLTSWRRNTKKRFSKGAAKSPKPVKRWTHGQPQNSKPNRLN